MKDYSELASRLRLHLVNDHDLDEAADALESLQAARQAPDQPSGELPPLPDGEVEIWGKSGSEQQNTIVRRLFTADQMRDYAALCRSIPHSREVVALTDEHILSEIERIVDCNGLEPETADGMVALIREFVRVNCRSAAQPAEPTMGAAIKRALDTGETVKVKPRMTYEGVLKRLETDPDMDVEAGLGIASRDETAWLLEWHFHGQLYYFGINEHFPEFDFSTAEKATRFARKEDAEKAKLWVQRSDSKRLRGVPRDLRVAEHMWPALQGQQSAPPAEEWDAGSKLYFAATELINALFWIDKADGLPAGIDGGMLDRLNTALAAFEDENKVRAAPPVSRDDPTDEEIVSLAAQYGSWNPSVWDTGIPQYHAGQPGLIAFARALKTNPVLAANANPSNESIRATGDGEKRE